VHKTSILHLSFSLFIITFVVAVMLSVVNYFTAPVIKNSERNIIKNSLEIIYEGADFEEIEVTPQNQANGIVSVYKAEELGYCLNVVTNGYGGELKLLIGINRNLSVAGVEVISSNETQNIGSKALEKSYLDKFISLTSPYNVNAVSGATITSKAVKDSIEIATASVKELIANE